MSEEKTKEAAARGAITVVTATATTAITTQDPKSTSVTAASAGLGMATNVASTATTAALDNAVKKLSPAQQAAIKAALAVGATLVGAIASLGLQAAVVKASKNNPLVLTALNQPSPSSQPVTVAPAQQKPVTEQPVAGTQHSATGQQSNSAAPIILASVIIGGKYLIENVVATNSVEQYGHITTADITIPYGFVRDIKNKELLHIRDIPLSGQSVTISIYDKNKEEQEGEPSAKTFLLYIISHYIDLEKGYIENEREASIAPLHIKACSIFEYLHSGPQSHFFTNQTIEYIVNATLSPALSNFPNIKLLIDGVDPGTIPIKNRLQETPYHFIQRLADEYGYYFYTTENYIIFGCPHHTQSKYPNKQTKPIRLQYGTGYTGLNIYTQMHPINTSFTDHSTGESTNYNANIPIDLQKTPFHPLVNNALAASQQQYGTAHHHGVGGHGVTQKHLEQIQQRLQQQNASAMVKICLSTCCYSIGLCDDIEVEFTDHNKINEVLYLRCTAVTSYVDGYGYFQNHLECMLA